MKQKNGSCPGEPFEVTLYDYYLKHQGTEFKESRNLPCLDVGKLKRPVYIPLEVISYPYTFCYSKNLYKCTIN